MGYHLIICQKLKFILMNELHKLWLTSNRYMNAYLEIQYENTMSHMFTVY